MPILCHDKRKFAIFLVKIIDVCHKYQVYTEIKSNGSALFSMCTTTKFSVVVYNKILFNVCCEDSTPFNHAIFFLMYNLFMYFVQNVFLPLDLFAGQFTTFFFYFCIYNLVVFIVIFCVCIFSISITSFFSTRYVQNTKMKQFAKIQILHFFFKLFVLYWVGWTYAFLLFTMKVMANRAENLCAFCRTMFFF